MPLHDPSTEAAFDVREIPFSRRGSWLDLSPVVALHTCTDTIHLVSHRNGLHGVLTLRPERGGQPVEAAWSANPTILTWTTDDGRVEAAFAGTDAVRFRGSGLALRLGDAAAGLTPFTGTYLFTDPSDGADVFTSYETGHRYRVTMLRGERSVEGSEALGTATRSILLGSDGGDWEAEVREATSQQTVPAEAASFEEVVADSAEDFASYLDDLAPWRGERTPAAALAAYVLWSATVAPSGLLGRESVLMSKHWMDKLWSWDHCFNAMALAPGRPDAALDQFLAPFDHQDDRGALPDSVSHSEILYNYVKPPIHGWALPRLRTACTRPLGTDELERIHDGLVRWSRFWLDSRRRPGHDLPYYQHGNDSGWDNSTTFDLDRVIESPDLAAFLAVQLDVLADLADELGHPSAGWRKIGEELVTALVDQLWTGTEFVAVGALSGRRSTGTSLLNLLPLVLGDRLPADIREAMADRLGDHLTDYGPATEPVSSPHYQDDGYWRGPIWAPSTALIEDGLRRSGYAAVADVVSERFRALCEKSGFAENFDARTGAGLRDRAYTWTAAVYLLFAADHLRRS
ncbi:MAG: glycogen debranching protein [Actinomycetota bacterium]|nr:glycogen debranching protein [Actinomycetota bacterium]